MPEPNRGAVYGSPASRWGTGRPPRGYVGPVVVAAAVDALHFGRDCRVVYVEHGAGQSYHGDQRGAASPSYSGGPGLDHVELFVCPNQRVADRWAAIYPAARTAVVGCPRLDQHHPTPAARVPGDPRVLICFHWDCKLIPETRSAWKHWRQAVLDLARLGDPDIALAAHVHPRAPEVAATFATCGIPVIANVDDALRWADLVVADNTSVLYEACAIGKATLVLNAPWYRRGVDHGMRFWSAVPGPMLDDPAALASAIAGELDYPLRHAAARCTAAVAAFDRLVDGRAAERAAAALGALT